MRRPRDSWQQCGILNEETKKMTTAKDKIMTITPPFIRRSCSIYSH